MRLINNFGRSISALFLCICLFFLSGCTQRIGDLSLISTKNIELRETHVDPRQGRRVKGQDCVFLFFGVLNLEEAVDEALEKGNGNLMVDEVTHLIAYPFVSCLEVEGTVHNIKADL